MGQFGPNMNFLGIIQVQMIIFTLTIHFHNLLSNLWALWAGAWKQGSAGFTAQKVLRLRIPLLGLRVYFTETEGLVRKITVAKGYSLLRAAQIRSNGPNQTTNRYRITAIGSWISGHLDIHALPLSSTHIKEWTTNNALIKSLCGSNPHRPKQSDGSEFVFPHADQSNSAGAPTRRCVRRRAAHVATCPNPRSLTHQGGYKDDR